MHTFRHYASGRTTRFCHVHLFFASLLVLALLPTLANTKAEEPQNADQADQGVDIDVRVQQLIEQLGSPQYATRQRAKTELQRLRLEAFDALTAAQEHDDIEIALSARYLVRSMQVSWWTDDDPSEVQQLLRDYGTRTETERHNLMEQLAGLGRAAALRPLSRLVRYEASDLLSRQAALQILLLEAPEDPAGREQLAQELLSLAGRSRRDATAWLRAYAQWLSGAENAHQLWTELIVHEKAKLMDDPSEMGRAVTRDLLKWYADALTRQGQQEQAVAMMRQSIDLLNPQPRELLEAADWFRKRGCWEIMIELADRFSDTFEANPLLQYRRAMAYRQLGQNDQAAAAARTAAEAIGDKPQDHLEIAVNLQQDGIFEWSEAEYRAVAKVLDTFPPEAVRARLFLAEMLHDLGSELKAGTELRELLDQVETQESLRKTVEEEMERDLNSITSRMHFFLSQHHRQVGDAAKEKEELKAGFECDPFDADVLIGMHRASESDAAWSDMTRKAIQAAVEHFRGQKKELLERMETARAFEEKTVAQYQLATAYNQLAWLVANTEGDFDESLTCSQKSLELIPGRAGFLDTLGRCYYAKKDLVNAVKYQTQAVAKDPHSPLMLKQLELFRQTLQQQQATEAKAAAQ